MSPTGKEPVSSQFAATHRGDSTFFAITFSIARRAFNSSMPIFKSRCNAIAFATMGFGTKNAPSSSKCFFAS